MLVPAAQVAGAVNLYRLAIYDDISEHFLGQFLTLPVAGCHLHASQTQFSGHALQQQPPAAVDDICRLIVERTANGYIVILPSWLKFIPGGIHGELRRSVSIDEPTMA